MFTETEESEFEVQQITSFLTSTPTRMVSSLPMPSIKPSILSHSTSGRTFPPVSSSTSQSSLAALSCVPSSASLPLNLAKNAVFDHMKEMTATCAEMNIEAESFQGECNEILSSLIVRNVHISAICFFVNISFIDKV